MFAKKSLGQNFLKNEGILQKIADAAEIGKDDTVLEIGPGHGALTKYLFTRAKKVIAVEKDQDLSEELVQTFQKEIKDETFELILGDALLFDPKIVGTAYIIVANIPYNITGAFFRKYLGAELQPKSMTVLIQEEVADRIIARDGKESILSIAVKAYGKPKKLFTVSPGSFVPVPKVTSAVLQITAISRENFKHNDENLFFELLRAGFAHKRKLLKRNLEEKFGKGALDAAFADISLDHNSRAEDLSLEQWLTLSHRLSNKNIG